MENNNFQKRIEDIRATNGKAIIDIPENELTSSICKLAVDLNPKMVAYVPNKYLPEILSGEDFIEEVIRRKLAISNGEASMFSMFLGKEFDREKYIHDQMEVFKKFLIDNVKKLNIDANEKKIVATFSNLKK